MNGTSYQTARIDKCSVASERREREKDEHEISRSDVCRLFIGRGEGAQRRCEVKKEIMMIGWLAALS